MFISKFFSAKLQFMQTSICKKLATGLYSGLLTLCVIHSAYAVPTQDPLFLSNPVVPLAMLNMSKDHQLYMKLYDDYSDITDTRATVSGNPNPNYGKFAQDGVIDTTYVNIYDYYGYFDSGKCYSYSATNKRFEPAALVNASKYCDGTTWSGNFLNWATMTRIDAVRKMLFGGYRSKDDTETVLERVLLPQDGHAFAKYYNNSDLSQLMPTTVIDGADLGLASTFKETGITFCNTTRASNGMSQAISTATNPPVLRIAKGNFSLWASNERWQCTWNEEHSATNSNKPADSGIYAFNSNPKRTGLTAGNSAGGFDARGDGDGDGIVDGDFIVRVQVCKNSTLKESNCFAYPNGNLKPRGLLHKYGEDFDNKKAKILFGLMTGSYSKNKQGGVLRKNISNLSDEVDSNSGIFSAIAPVSPAVPSGIIATLSMMRIRGYSFSDGTYLGSKGSGGDDCPWQKNGFVDSQCTNWGNPQSELYLQSLRYFAGKFGATSDPFDTTDNTTNTGIYQLPKVEPNKGTSANTTVNTTWMDPLTAANYCTPLNVIQFNATVSSYDNDDISAFKDQISSGTELSTVVDMIGDSTHENLYTGKFFVGNATTATPTSSIDLCDAKALTGLSLVTGTCPDAPHLRGSYNIAGMASYARENDLRSDLKDKQVIRTYGVELAPAIPSVELQIPGNTTKTVRILPACANHGTGSGATGNCGLVGFRVVSQTSSTTEKTGTLYVNWEESEQGGDFDQDMWGVISYKLTSNNLNITTKVLAKSTSSRVGFGYILSGTSTGDGFQVWSGANGFTYPDPSLNEQKNSTLPTQCNNCNVADPAVSKDYPVGDSSTASFLGSPLFYAAKWGGYSSDFVSAAQDDAAKKGKTYDTPYLHSLVKNRSTSDSYFFATDPVKLEDSLDKTFSNVANDTGSAASVATNSARLAEDNYIFQAQFRSGSWDGSIKGYEFDSKGEIKTTAPLVSSVPTTRKIYIKKGAGLADFNWSNLVDLSLSSQFILSPESTDVNAKKRIDWILGSETDEFSITNNTGIFRSRTFTVTDTTSTTQVRNVFGDIVNSSPAYVGGFNYRYNSLTEGGSDYAEFVAKKLKKDPMIYVGANDGMLHAFDAKTLTEKFAYVVTATLSKMAKLPALDYGKNLNKHQYLVDGPVVTGDAYFQGASESSKSWHSIIVGTLGAGGKGIYALDVTDAADPKLLWELTDTDIPGLGYVMGKPFIVPLTNGRWGVVLGNGDSSTSPLSKLMVIDLVDPLTKTTTLNTTKGKGLSAPAVLVNAKGEATTVYAGDTKGNLFKFDLKDSTPANWTSSLIFVAKDSANNLQPITAAPTIGINNQLGGKYMVYFGTGKYYDDGDNTTPSWPKYSFYGVADMGTLLSRTNLLSKTISYDAKGNRVVSTTNPNWSSEYGWYLDFTDTGGERVTTKALLIQDKLIFPTLIPSPDTCDFGGKSWLMEVTAVGDKFIGTHLLDVIVKSEFLILGDLGFGVVSEGKGAILASTSKATLLNKSVSLTAGDFSRQSWRQLR
jgi:type IV pilus assembly protein PilY1